MLHSTLTASQTRSTSKGVGHAFANPSGDNYVPEETTDAWDKTLAFLEKYV